MRSRFLPCCGAVALSAFGPAAIGRPAPVDAPSDGPRLIGRGTTLTQAEHLAYALRSELCPRALRVELVGGDLTDTEVILIAIIVGLAVVVVVLAIV